MNYTKQDIQKLAAALGRIGVKDTQFSVLPNVANATKFTVIQGDRNYTVSATNLMQFIQNSIDLGSIGVTDGDGEKTSLISWLYDIETKANAKNTGQGVDLIAENIGCSVYIGDTRYNKVSNVLSAICGILSGISSFPTEASSAEINNVFTITNN